MQIRGRSGREAPRLLASESGASRLSAQTTGLDAIVPFGAPETALSTSQSNSPASRRPHCRKVVRSKRERGPPLSARSASEAAAKWSRRDLWFRSVAALPVVITEGSRTPDVVERVQVFDRGLREKR